MGDPPNSGTLIRTGRVEGLVVVNFSRSLSRTRWVRSASGITMSEVAWPVVASCLMCWIFHFVQNSFDLEGGMGR